MSRTEFRTETPAELVSLLDELLDAHLDTLELAARPCDELRRRAHNDYLRALRRRGIEILAAHIAGDSSRGAA